jgi:hypothetical protein
MCGICQNTLSICIEASKASEVGNNLARSARNAAIKEYKLSKEKQQYRGNKYQGLRKGDPTLRSHKDFYPYSDAPKGKGRNNQSWHYDQSYNQYEHVPPEAQEGAAWMSGHPSYQPAKGKGGKRPGPYVPQATAYQKGGKGKRGSWY